LLPIVPAPVSCARRRSHACSCCGIPSAS
jgi:hypothetical protein